MNQDLIWKLWGSKLNTSQIADIVKAPEHEVDRAIYRCLDAIHAKKKPASWSRSAWSKSVGLEGQPITLHWKL